jgi:hypothetical protein
MVPDAASVSNARRPLVGLPCRLWTACASERQGHRHSASPTLLHTCLLATSTNRRRLSGPRANPSPEGVGSQCRNEPTHSMECRPYDQVRGLIPQDDQAFGPPGRSAAAQPESNWTDRATQGFTFHPISPASRTRPRFGSGEVGARPKASASQPHEEAGMPSIDERHDDRGKRGLDMLRPHCAIARIPVICDCRNRFTQSIEIRRGVLRDHPGPHG